MRMTSKDLTRLHQGWDENTPFLVMKRPVNEETCLACAYEKEMQKPAAKRNPKFIARVKKHAERLRA